MATQSEQYLASLCERAFLRLWSYLSPFRDQGQKDDRGDGKELCDLLVVFDDDILVFSDKWCEFPATGDLTLDWQRWKRRAITDGSRQVIGAERWVRQFPSRVFQDSACQVPLFAKIPESSQIRTHKIVVAHGSAQRCRETFGGGSGSNILWSYDQYATYPDIDNQPFHLCREHDPAAFVHVFDDVSLDIVLENLDTIADFVGYLKLRAEVLSTDHTFRITGEEELLSIYMRHFLDTGATGLPDLLLSKERLVLLSEGLWDEYLQTDEYKVLKTKLDASHYWDELIDRFARHSIGGTLEHSTHPAPSEQIQILRVLAKEHRIARTILSSALVSFLVSVPLDQVSMRTVISPTDDKTAYVFMARPYQPALSMEKNRENRKIDLFNYCFASKLRLPDVTCIIGIATEPAWSEKRSEDLIILDVSDWSSDDDKMAAEVIRETGYTTRVSEKRSKGLLSDRGSDLFHGIVPKLGRNDECPCGSGKKYKRCCMRSNG